MSFWQSELGELTGAPQDSFSRGFSLIPDGTQAIAKIISFKNDEYQGKKKIKIEWELVEGEFSSRHVFQTLWVYEENSKSRHISLNMLVLIFKLFNINPKNNEPPTDDDLEMFVGKIAGVKINESKPNKNGNQYNNVIEVHPAAGFEVKTGKSLPLGHYRDDSALTRHAHTKSGPSQMNDFDDSDIPF
jgi:hypothetical protein